MRWNFETDIVLNIQVHSLRLTGAHAMTNMLPKLVFKSLNVHSFGARLCMSVRKCLYMSKLRPLHVDYMILLLVKDGNTKCKTIFAVASSAVHNLQLTRTRSYDFGRAESVCSNSLGSLFPIRNKTGELITYTRKLN